MKKIYVAITLLGICSFWGCKNETKNESESLTESIEAVKEEVAPMNQQFSIKLDPKSGSKASGQAYFIEQDGRVVIQAKISGLEPGVHAVHLHEKSDCSAEDGTSTGGHWNPTFENHGKWGAAEGYHKGDIGNFTVDEDGMGLLEFETDEWCIGCGDEKKDILGKAVIVHKDADDYTTQPTGNAGSRVICGGVIQ